MSKYSLLVCLVIIGCNDFAFGVVGTQTKTTTKTKISAPPIYSSPYSCTTDDQCGYGLSCYKEESYVGICVKFAE